MWLVRLVAAFTIGTLATGCGSDERRSAVGTTTTRPTTSTQGDACSATEIRDRQPSDQPGLPAAVAATRAAVIEAALDCDFDTLEGLAVEGDGTFSYTFGGEETGGVSEYWRQREAEGEDVLRLLVLTLQLPFVAERGMFVWPSADQKQPDDQDWAALRGLYSDTEITMWREGGSGFLGYRAGIAEDGDWQFFIAGD